MLQVTNPGLDRKNSSLNCSAIAPSVVGMWPVVPAPGFEPGPSQEERILSPLRLPFRQAGAASVPPPWRPRQGGWRGALSAGSADHYEHPDEALGVFPCVCLHGFSEHRSEGALGLGRGHRHAPARRRYQQIAGRNRPVFDRYADIDLARQGEPAGRKSRPRASRSASRAGNLQPPLITPTTLRS